jgi:hypothetical protein
MFFNFKLFFEFLNITFIKPQGHYRLTLHRFLMVSLFLIVYLPLEIFTRLCYIFDELFFPGYRQQKVKQPVFIIGNFRSGTTFMQRILAKDKDRFVGIKAWEIVFAPSIIMRKIVRIILKIDAKIGNPIRRLILASEKQTLHKIDFHHFRWNDYEEDDFFNMHSFSCFGLWIYSVPFIIVKDLMRFDEVLPNVLRQRIMAFYDRLIKRHLYAHGSKKRLLSKNPTCTSKIESLLEVYPDAKFILIVRDPQEVIPSQMNMLAFGWNKMANPLVPFPYAEEIMEMTEYFYRYPDKKLRELPDDQKYVVEYRQLIANPKATIEKIYRRFGFELSQQYWQTLKKESALTQNHQNGRYPLSKMGLRKAQIAERFDYILDEIEFSDTSHPPMN